MDANLQVTEFAVGIGFLRLTEATADALKVPLNAKLRRLRSAMEMYDFH